jgi:LPXTG-site transpeptidase (sortase) family protein
MRKSLIIFLIIGGIVIGIGIFNSLLNSGAIESKQQSMQNSASVQTENLINNPGPEVLKPAIFSIPELGLENIEVESVGLDKDSKMDIPSDENNVAWYNLGSKPGERGNAVIAGHFDKRNGEPAVFYDINKLKAGDEIKVKDIEGKEFTYLVTDSVSYELAEFPLVEVFGAGDKARLNLITCEGSYDKASKLYSHRLVVYSELKQT